MKGKFGEIRRSFNEAIYTEEEEYTKIILNEVNAPDVERLMKCLKGLFEREKEPDSISAFLKIPPQPPFCGRARKLGEVCRLCSLRAEFSHFKWVCSKIKKIWKKKRKEAVYIALREVEGGGGHKQRRWKEMKKVLTQMDKYKVALVVMNKLKGKVEVGKGPTLIEKLLNLLDAERRKRVEVELIEKLAAESVNKIKPKEIIEDDFFRLAKIFRQNIFKNKNAAKNFIEKFLSPLTPFYSFRAILPSTTEGLFKQNIGECC